MDYENDLNKSGYRKLLEYKELTEHGEGLVGIEDQDLISQLLAAIIHELCICILCIYSVGWLENSATMYQNAFLGILFSSPNV